MTLTDFYRLIHMSKPNKIVSYTCAFFNFYKFYS
jgi:hypothetical protein